MASLATRTAYFGESSGLLVLTQKVQSPRWVSCAARTCDTSGAPESFAIVNAALTSSTSFFPSGGGGTTRGGDSFASSAAQPAAIKQNATINIRRAVMLDLSN